MEFTFDSPKMARFAPSQEELASGDKKALRKKMKLATRKLGTQCAKQLHNRLSELDAAANVAELVAGDPHEYSGNRRGDYSLDIGKDGRLLFRPNHRKTPTTPAGNIDWKNVTKVIIIHIGGHIK